MFSRRTGRWRHLVFQLRYLQFDISNGICDDEIIDQIMHHLVGLHARSSPMHGKVATRIVGQLTKTSGAKPDVIRPHVPPFVDLAQLTIACDSRQS